MASQIRSPSLASTTPPFFSVAVGYSAKVIANGHAVWVKIIEIRGDEFLGIVRSTRAGFPAPELRKQDVIEFTRANIFGMF